MQPRQPNTTTTRGTTTSNVLARPMVELAELVAGLRLGGGRVVEVCLMILSRGVPIQIKYVGTASKSLPHTGKPQWLYTMLQLILNTDAKNVQTHNKTKTNQVV